MFNLLFLMLAWRVLLKLQLNSKSGCQKDKKKTSEKLSTLKNIV